MITDIVKYLVGKVEALIFSSQCVGFTAGLDPWHPSINTDLQTAWQKHVRDITSQEPTHTHYIILIVLKPLAGGGNGKPAVILVTALHNFIVFMYFYSVNIQCVNSKWWNSF